MRTKKAIYNSISKLLYEVVAAVSGLILPRLILSNFGSDYNGVIASISQFIGYTSLLTAGVGGVTQADTRLTVNEADDARTIHDMLLGIVALASLSSEGNKAADFLQTVKIEQKETDVAVTVKLDHPDLWNVISQALQKAGDEILKRNASNP